MPDFLVRDIDPAVAERIKQIARDRGWPINDVILRLLAEAVGLATPEPPQPGDIARLSGSYRDEEARAFDEALQALEKMPEDRFY